MVSSTTPSIGIAAATFVATNLDDMVLVTLLFAQNGRRSHAARVVAGQYLGFTAMICLSLAVSFLGRSVPHEWIGILGVIPIAMAVRRWTTRRDNAQPFCAPETLSTMGIASLTLLNGADNIAAYSLLFATTGNIHTSATIATLYLLLIPWCVVGHSLGRHPATSTVFLRYGRHIIPLALLALGSYILFHCGTLQALVPVR